MKICYVISTVNVAGGANRSLLDFLPYMIRAGHECTVLACAHGSMEEAVKDLGAEYKVLPFATYVKAPTALRQAKRLIANAVGKPAITAYFKSQCFDLIHNNSLPTAIGMDVANKLNIPYVCHIRENVWDGLGMEFYCPKRIKEIVSKASCVITISNYINATYCNRFPNENYFVINDGINVDDYYSNREIFKTDSIRLGIVGIINPQKGQYEAIKAVKLLHNKGYTNISLFIIGNDGKWDGSSDYARHLKAEVEGDHLDYIRFIPAIEDLEGLRKQRETLDINLVCSSAEGLGRTTIESMLSGALTIAADAGATAEVVKDHEFGLLYESGNYRDLAEKIEYAIKHTDEMRKMAGNAREQAKERYSVNKYASKLLDVYNNIRGK